MPETVLKPVIQPTIKTHFIFILAHFIALSIHTHTHTKHYFHIRGERAVAGRRDLSFLHLLGWLAAISPVSSWSSFSAFCCVCSRFLCSFIHEYTLTCCLSVYRLVQMDRRAEFSLHLYIKFKLIFFCIFIVDILILHNVWTYILHKVVTSVTLLWMFWKEWLMCPLKLKIKSNFLDGFAFVCVCVCVHVRACVHAYLRACACSHNLNRLW